MSRLKFQNEILKLYKSGSNLTKVHTGFVPANKGIVRADNSVTWKVKIKIDTEN